MDATKFNTGTDMVQYRFAGKVTNQSRTHESVQFSVM